MPQDPMSLEDLPEYLKKLKQNGSTGGSPVVGTGQIIMDDPAPNWVKRIALTAILGIFMVTGSMIAYDKMSTKNITVVVATNNASPQTISEIMTSGGGQVLSVKQNEDSTYEVKVATKKSKSSFLEWLRKNKDVKKAELE